MIAAGIAGCVLGFVIEAMGAVENTEGERFLEADSCENHLDALVMYLQETAHIEGRRLSVERGSDGAVLMRYRDFSQRMWCQDDDLHIDCIGQ